MSTLKSLAPNFNIVKEGQRKEGFMNVKETTRAVGINTGSLYKIIV